MALVKLARDWFGPDGTRYRKRDGMIEIPDSLVESLPKSAKVYDGKGLPSAAPVPRPGHGAKPLEEQNLDLIPGAAPTHQITAPDPSTEASKEDEKEEQKQVTEGLAAAHKAEEAQAKALDPVKTPATPAKKA